MIHAVDGLGTGIVIVPVMGNFMIKIYRMNETGKGRVGGNPYGKIVKALIELSTFLIKN